MRDLLGLTIKLDNAVGEKVAPALTQMFEILKPGSTYVKALKKELSAKNKLTVDMTALEKLQALLADEQGLATKMDSKTSGVIMPNREQVVL